MRGEPIPCFILQDNFFDELRKKVNAMEDTPLNEKAALQIIKDVFKITNECDASKNFDAKLDKLLEQRHRIIDSQVNFSQQINSAEQKPLRKSSIATPKLEVITKANPDATPRNNDEDSLKKCSEI